MIISKFNIKFATIEIKIFFSSRIFHNSRLNYNINIKYGIRVLFVYFLTFIFIFLLSTMLKIILFPRYIYYTFDRIIQYERLVKRSLLKNKSFFFFIKNQFNKSYLIKIIFLILFFLLQLDGRMLAGQMKQVSGGVGRNIADALGRFGHDVRFVSVVGNDSNSDLILKSLHHIVNTFDLSIFALFG